MGSEDTVYMARVNAAVWLIRKAGKIARRLNGTTPDQRQAVEDEIVAIGQRMYDEMRQQPQPEDHKQEAYAAAVRAMVPNAGPELIAHFKSKGFSSEQAADSFVRLFGTLERNAEKQ